MAGFWFDWGGHAFSYRRRVARRLPFEYPVNAKQA